MKTCTMLLPLLMSMAIAAAASTVTRHDDGALPLARGAQRVEIAGSTMPIQSHQSHADSCVGRNARNSVFDVGGVIGSCEEIGVSPVQGPATPDTGSPGGAAIPLSASSAPLLGPVQYASVDYPSSDRNGFTFAHGTLDPLNRVAAFGQRAVGTGGFFGTMPYLQVGTTSLGSLSPSSTSAESPLRSLDAVVRTVGAKMPVPASCGLFGLSLIALSFIRFDRSAGR